MPREERATFKRQLRALVASGKLIEIRGQRFGLPGRMNLIVGRVSTNPRGFAFVDPEAPDEHAPKSIYIAGNNLNQAMHGDRVVVRVEQRARRARRRPHRSHPRARRPAHRRPLRSRRRGAGVRRPVRSAAGDGRRGAKSRVARRGPRRDGDAADHAVADADAPAGRPHLRGARQDRRSGRRHGGHHPQVQPPGRAQRGGDRRGATTRHVRARSRPRRPHGFPRLADGHDRRRARARFRRRDFDRQAAERQLLARRPHRGRRALRPGGQRAQPRRVRSQHVGLFPRACGPHVSVRALDGPVQPQPARRSARAVVPDGDRRPQRRRCPLRTARRRDSQPGAHDLHVGQRDPDRSRRGS